MAYVNHQAMKKHLFFICPADYLEGVINSSFDHENYFVTSLGNSIQLSSDEVEEIKELIETKGIRKITFVLSADNPIVLDAMGKQEFSDIQGLGRLYVETAKQKAQFNLLWQKSNPRISILSHHLKMKIKELRSKLGDWLVDQMIIKAKVYCRRRNIFIEVDHDLIHRESYHLN